jgi:hypothetical protein
MRVRLYRNLKIRDQRAWSIMAMEGPRKGKVLEIVDGAVLRRVTFTVSEPGRQRVIRERAKNVHAYVDGELEESFPLKSMRPQAGGEGADVRITYDPYTMRSFVRTDCMKPVEHASVVFVSPAGVFAMLPACGSRSVAGLAAALECSMADDWNG